MIFNIQRYSTHDGEGIRTLIFYKGCPLRCQWCSNPESHSFDSDLIYDRMLCRNFGDCLKTESKAITRLDPDGVQIHRELLGEPGKLKDLCASKAITLSGEKKSVEELLLEIEKDVPFYREDGGVTLSGGEPLSQGEELIELLQQLNEKQINVNMETSLHVKWERVERCIGLVDTFLTDLKHLDREKFRTYIHGDAELVMNNLVKLCNTSAHVIVRIPVIPGFNQTEKEMTRMIDFVLALKTIREIHFLPYHSLGVEKYKMLGLDYPFGNIKQVRDWELAPYIQYAQSKGLYSKIGG